MTDPKVNIPNVNSTDSQWILWHKSLVKYVTKKYANEIFLERWEAVKSANSGWTGGKANTSTLRSYLKEQGIEISPDGALAYVESLVDNIESGIESAFGVSKTIFIVIAIIVLVPVAMFLFNVAKQPGLIVDGLKAAHGK